MPTSILPPTSPTSAPSSRKRAAPKHELALEQLDVYCRTLQSGDRLPALPELMRRFQSSERSVLKALDELQRQGRIVRRHGSGTFIAEPGSAPPLMTTVGQQTILAIRTPDNSYFDRCVDLLFRHTDAAGLPLVCRIVSPTAPPDALEPGVTEGMLGVLLFRYDFAPLAQKIQEQGTRVVIVGAPPADVTPEVPCVYGDHEQGGYFVTRHLLDLGHRRIAYHLKSANSREQLRWFGHQRAVQEARRQWGAQTVLDSVLPESEVANWKAHPEQARAFLRQPDAPTALVMWNDHEAVRLVLALNAAGIRIPEDLSVIGYDDLPEGQMVRPRLTTVDPAIDWQLRTALDLLRRPNLTTTSHASVVLPTLVPRDSTAAPPIRQEG